MKRFFLILAVLALQSCLSGSDDPDIPVLSSSLAWKTFDPAGQGEDRRNLAGRVVWTTLSADTVLCALDEYADHSCRDLRKLSECGSGFDRGAVMVGDHYVEIESTERECLFDARDGMRLVASKDVDSVWLGWPSTYMQRSGDSTTFLSLSHGWITSSGVVPVDWDTIEPQGPEGRGWLNPSGNEVCVAANAPSEASYQVCLPGPGQPMRLTRLNSVMDGAYQWYGIVQWNDRLWAIQRFEHGSMNTLVFLDSIRLVSVALDGGDPHTYPACRLPLYDDGTHFSGVFRLFRAGNGLAVAADKWDGNRENYGYNKLLVSISQGMEIQIVGEYQYINTYEHPEDDLIAGTWVGIPDGELLNIGQFESANSSYYSGKVLFYRYGTDGKLVQ